MWLLSTSRAELHFFADPNAVPGGYAILSHTWNGQEQSFHDVQRIHALCEETGDNPRDHVSAKIRNCCAVAERDGYAWAWIDVCCINKESSTELSEAINSMFSWYVCSEVCYAFLEDVSKDDDPRAENSEFRNARWHTRGWTLQELLAPAYVVFMSKEWEPIGTKHDLVDPLSDCTGIYEGYLLRHKNFLYASIAQRMAWAAKRKTTRIEDEAYCLLGLFDVNIPTIYGEGSYAFQRLQQELAKRQHVDTTLFVWGSRHDDACNELPAEKLPEIWSGFHDVNHPERFLFAPNPREFSIGATPYYTPNVSASDVLQPFLPSQWTEENDGKADKANKETGPFGHLELPSFEDTSHGLKCRFPVAEVDGFIIAVLLVETMDVHLGLLLHPAEADELQDPSRKMYYIGWPFKTENTYFNCRTAFIGNDLYNLSFRGTPLKPEWRDIYVHTSPQTSDRVDPAHLILKFWADRAPAPFRVPRFLLSTLTAIKLLPAAGRSSRDEAAENEMWLEFTNTVASEKVRITLGLCTRAGTEERPVHFAWAEMTFIDDWNDPWHKQAHDCAADHVDDWSEGASTFGDVNAGLRIVRLTFTRARDAPEKTRVLGLELRGEVYEKFQEETGFFLSNHVQVGKIVKAERQSRGSHLGGQRIGNAKLRSAEKRDTIVIVVISIVVSASVSALISGLLARAIASH